MAKVIMIQGTMSNAGKSLICAGLCRIFKQDGYRVAPFKSQNMALNSYITEDGLEMGRAQAVQAEAAGIKPSVFMNPILLKPVSDAGSQVIVNGCAIGNMMAREYFAYKKKLIPDIKYAFKKLSEQNDIIVIEGAGSPAEINLKENDIVNMGMADMVDAPVLLVGDIDRGGVFAQLLGTIMLLEENEKDRIKGLIVNKFRGDKTILDPGIRMLEERGGVPVAGVVPYMKLFIEDEDSLSEKLDSRRAGIIDMAVIRLPHISNFTDFDVFEQIEAAGIRYVTDVKELGNPDIIFIPGSKNTIEDLKWMRSCGLESAIKKKSEDTIIFGICGGYQMLGMSIDDPLGAEAGGSIIGMELLPVKTTLSEKKITTRTEGKFMKLSGPLEALSGIELSGYEIHMGITEAVESTEDKNKDISSGALTQTDVLTTGRIKSDGCFRGNVYGSYIHGIFDYGDAAAMLVNILAERKGVTADTGKITDYEDFKESQYNKLADILREYLDMDYVYSILNEADIKE